MRYRQSFWEIMLICCSFLWVQGTTLGAPWIGAAVGSIRDVVQSVVAGERGGQ